MKRFLFFAAFAAAALVSCNKEETAPVPEGSRVVKFTMNNFYQFDTKAALAVDGHVAIYAGAPINFKNADYTVSAMPVAEPAAAGTLSGSSIRWGVEQIGTAPPPSSLRCILAKHRMNAKTLAKITLP